MKKQLLIKHFQAIFPKFMDRKISSKTSVQLNDSFMSFRSSDMLLGDIELRNHVRIQRGVSGSEPPLENQK